MAIIEALALPAPAARCDGWSPERQRAFLEALAETGVVRAACEACGLSTRSAYNLRFRVDGTAFRLGWDAALLLARARLADELMARAIEGQEDVLVHGEDGVVTRRRHDNRLAMSMLSRLDRLADPASDGDAALARIVARDFEAFLDMISRRGVEENAAGLTAATALFLATRRPDMAAPVPGQERCELRREVDAPPPADPTPEEAVAALRGVWWCDVRDELRTDFPPPPGFGGDEDGAFGDPGYDRALGDREAAAQRAINERLIAPVRAATAEARDAYFGFVAGRPRKRGARTLSPRADITDAMPFPEIPPPAEYPVQRDPPAYGVSAEQAETPIAAGAPAPSTADADLPYRTVRPCPRSFVAPGRPPPWATPL